MGAAGTMAILYVLLSSRMVSVNTGVSGKCRPPGVIQPLRRVNLRGANGTADGAEGGAVLSVVCGLRRRLSEQRLS